MDYAGCSATRSLSVALTRVCAIVYREFNLTGDQPKIQGSLGTCSAIRERWLECKAHMLQACGSRGKRSWFRLRSLLKSCDRLFDRECRCDFVTRPLCKNEWKKRMQGTKPVGSVLGIPGDRCISELQARVRILIDGWGRRLEGRRKEEGVVESLPDVYIPDQQGCYERSSLDGGTLSVPLSEYGDTRDNVVQLGAAKTKGKMRVVTMQSARVKAVLRPVHNALYDHITSFGWCVRGDVQKADFESVWTDRDPGAGVISGDYSAATDNISLDAVEAIIAVISESEWLTNEERSTLIDSFAGIEVRFSRMDSKNVFVVKRGSMMGNLVSFPLLCLLNKACFDWTCDLSGVGRRVGRFNGDDCLFSGDREFFDLWRRVTNVFGLEVNIEKTGFSNRWGELNSRVYDFRRHRFVGKPVLSFLRPAEGSQPDCILRDVLAGISTFRHSVQEWIVNDLMRYEICRRKICVSEIPGRWLRSLFRRRWFREACIKEPPSIIEFGTDRSVPVVLGPPPKPEYYEWVELATAKFNERYRDGWRGVSCHPFSVRLDRVQPIPNSLPRPPSFLGVRYSWRWLWPRGLLSFVEHRASWMLGDSDKEWLDDHPLLHRFAVVTGVGLRPKHLDEKSHFFDSSFWCDFPLGWR